MKMMRNFYRSASRLCTVNSVVQTVPKNAIGSSVDFTKNNYKVTKGDFNILDEYHISYFTELLGPHRILTDLSDLEKYNVDWFKYFRGNSRIVLKPKTTEEISKILSFCNINRLAVCPQGGNTSVVGGSVPVLDEVIISTSLMNEIVSLDETAGILVCQAGCVLETLDNFLAERGFIMPLDLGAKGSCHIGGNVSTNAGGIRLIRYGNLHGNVLGLEAVKANGEIIDCLNTLKKDNTGYHLKHLFIGSEGTLGFVTKVALQCPTKPKSINLAFLGIQKFEKVVSTYKQARKDLGEILSAVEVMDAATMEMVQQHLNLDSPIGEYPFYLIIETSGSSVEHDSDKLNKFLDTALTKHFVLNGTVVSDSNKYRATWSIRERIVETFAMDGYVFCYDISLPLEYYNLITREMREYMGRKSHRVTGFGHLGDGNLHINISVDEYSPEIRDYIESYLYRRVGELRGSISAEHGLGFLKAKHLNSIKSKPVVGLMKDLKNLMDPHGILNPYKVIVEEV